MSTPLDPAEYTPKLPGYLSPSSAQTFLQCPAQFYYKYVLKMPDPPSEAALRGSLAHAVLEDLLEWPRSERAEDAAVAAIPAAWQRLQQDKRSGEAYQQLAPAGSEAEQRVLSFTETMVRNYFTIEDPTRFDPGGLEVKLRVRMGGVTWFGFIDRLDCVPNREGEPVWYVSDYKTGKIPPPRFEQKAFFAMRLYAAMLKRMDGYEVQPQWLRLIYLQGTGRDAVKWLQVTDEQVAATERQAAQIWKGVQRAWREQDWPTKTSPLCDWCAFQSICPAWNPELAGSASPVRSEEAAPTVAS